MQGRGVRRQVSIGDLDRLSVTRCLVNPLCLFLLVWGAATALYLGGVRSGVFPSPASLTLALVLLNVVAFSLGYLTWTLFRCLDPRPPAPAIGSGRLLTRRVMVRGLSITLAAGGIALLLEMYRLLVIARYFDTTWFDLVTHPDVFRARQVAFIEATLLRTSGVVMLLSITNSLFSIGFVLLGVFLRLDGTRRKYLYLAPFLAITLTSSMIHLSRYEATMNILYLMFAYCLLCSPDRSDAGIPEGLLPAVTRGVSLVRLVIPIAAVVLLFVLIDVVLGKSGAYDQSSRLRGLAFHFFWYIASPLAAFNEFVATFTGDYQWGQNSFFPLYKWLCRFHLVPEAEMTIYGNRAFLPYMANVFTYLRNFYEDFGVLGVAVVPYLLGWATSALRERARRCLSFLNLYVVLLLLVFFSFYSYSLISNQTYLQILFGFVLFRYWMEPGSEKGGSGLL